MKTQLNRSIRLLLTAAVVALSAVQSNAGDFKGEAGLQLYSLRGEFTRYGVPKTLDLVKSYGIKEVELAGTYNLTPETFKEMLDERGLKPVSGHYDLNRLKNDPEGIAKEAKLFGMKYVGCPWIALPDRTVNEARILEAAEIFNNAGKVLAEHGVQLFYHPHGYEFVPHGDGTLFDLLVEKTHPKHVAFEMDVLWIMYPGEDPVEWLNKLGDRWQLMHLKDVRPGVPTGKTAPWPDSKSQIALGGGQADWPAILKTAQKIGIKHYLIEDESPVAETQIPQSVDYLSKVEFE